MPSSLRFVLSLFLSALIVAGSSLLVLNRQKESRIRIMAEQATGGHFEAGEAGLEKYGCGSCHEIPGTSAGHGRVGPSLKDFASRAHIAGVLANQPANLIRWIREPQAVLPGNGMPNQGITASEARNIAAYLYTLW